MSTPSQLHSSLLHYLTQLQQVGASADHGVVDAEPLEVALQCLTEATGAQPSPAKSDASLLEIFARGLKSIQDIEASPKWSQFLSLLQEKKFFEGVTPGSLSYAKRMEQARAKFEAKYANSSASASSSSAMEDVSAPAAEVTAESKAQAETAKNEGNALLSKGDHKGAIAKYTEAIKLNPNHAIYYANRAAAHINLKEYEEAVFDCKQSIDIDPAYPKSHYRLGQAYAALGEHEQCLPAFEKALELSSKDEGMAVTIREQIRVAKSKLGQSAPAASSAAANPFGGLGDLASSLGGLGGPGGFDFGSLMNNPMMQQMMNNPQIMEMAKNLDLGSLMKDMGPQPGATPEVAMAGAKEPSKVDTSYKPPAAESLFDDAPAAAAPASSSTPSSSSASSGGSVPPQLAAFLNTPAGRAAAADPDLQPVLADIQANGVGAAMKYLSNPAIMSKISALMGPLMGGK